MGHMRHVDIWLAGRQSGRQAGNDGMAESEEQRQQGIVVEAVMGRGALMCWAVIRRETRVLMLNKGRCTSVTRRGVAA